MSNARELYRWERLTKPKIYATKSQKTTDKSDIEDWLKKVEKASEQATDVVLGGNSVPVPSRSVVRKNTQKDLEKARIHNAAYVEAQDLLDNWMKEKLVLDEEDDREYSGPSDIQVQNEWDKILNEYESEMMALRTKPDTKKARSKCSNTSSSRDPANVESIVQSLLDKEYVSEYVIDDLGLDDDLEKKKKDPRLKMELRHEQVKRNRLQREAEQKKKLEEKIMKKNARKEAEKVIRQEEQMKKNKFKEEEEKIKEQMMYIRKEMEFEKRQKELALKKKKSEENMLKNKLKQKIEIKAIKVEEDETHERIASMKKILIQERLMAVEERQKRENMKIKQRYFIGWYNCILQSRLQLGKAKAFYDWKCLMKYWNSWKLYAIQQSMNKKAIMHQESVKTDQRKQMISVKHYHTTLLRKCFNSWKMYLEQAKVSDMFDENNERTKSKISAFLDALENVSTVQKEASKVNPVQVDDKQLVSELFNDKKAPKKARPTSATTSKPSIIPKEAWQVTKKHNKLTKEQILEMNERSREELGDDLVIEQQPSEDDTGRSSKAKKFHPPENYHHRHQAQQKILLEQQKELKEQKKLIEELHYLQKQQLLQQQLANNQTPDLIQKHLLELEKNLMDIASNYSDNQAAHRQMHEDKPTLEGESDIVSELPSQARRETIETERSEGSSNQSNSSKRHSDFLKAMEQRSAQRAALKKERETRRRQEEKEKLLRLEREANERKEREEEEKKKRIIEHRERKRQEMLQQQKKIEEQKRFQSLNQKAEEWATFATMKFRGWKPWRRFIQMINDRKILAEEKRKKTLLKLAFSAWSSKWLSIEEDRNRKANEFYRFNLQKHFIKRWEKIGKLSQIAEEKAAIHYRQKLLSKCLTSWVSYYDEEKIRTWRMENIADQHNTRRIQLTAIRCWQRLPQMKRAQEERTKRLSKIRQKVANILPDYDPNKSDTPRSSIT
ncbi:DgyrCDS4029 [Dimorphilus gyrociliatus]|uniref:DgyrCDS4029 n=1 Tax=Dimorphilus gyrociliatus TaxID=2664684 RepID=A0A7I8VFE1_9ANNE|nr:DgyrCDS4029 [Dimorphilus gyrociliatus]